MTSPIYMTVQEHIANKREKYWQDLITGKTYMVWTSWKHGHRGLFAGKIYRWKQEVDQ